MYMDVGLDPMNANLPQIVPGPPQALPPPPRPVRHQPEVIVAPPQPPARWQSKVPVAPAQVPPAVDPRIRQPQEHPNLNMFGQRVEPLPQTMAQLMAGQERLPPAVNALEAMDRYRDFVEGHTNVNGHQPPPEQLLRAEKAQNAAAEHRPQQNREAAMPVLRGFEFGRGIHERAMGLRGMPYGVDHLPNNPGPGMPHPRGNFMPRAAANKQPVRVDMEQRRPMENVRAEALDRVTRSRLKNPGAFGPNERPGPKPEVQPANPAAMHAPQEQQAFLDRHHGLFPGPGGNQNGVMQLHPFELLHNEPAAPQPPALLARVRNQRLGVEVGADDAPAPPAARQRRMSDLAHKNLNEQLDLLRVEHVRDRVQEVNERPGPGLPHFAFDQAELNGDVGVPPEVPRGRGRGRGFPFLDRVRRGLRPAPEVPVAVDVDVDVERGAVDAINAANLRRARWADMAILFGMPAAPVAFDHWIFGGHRMRGRVPGANDDIMEFERAQAHVTGKYAKLEWDLKVEAEIEEYEEEYEEYEEEHEEHEEEEEEDEDEEDYEE